MAEGAHVLSTDAIVQFEHALGRFVEQAATISDGIRGCVALAREEAEDECESKAIEVDSLSSNISGDDGENEELQGAKREFELLEGKHRRIRSISANVEQLLLRMKRSLDDDLPRARFELRRRIERLDDYQAITIDPGLRHVNLMPSTTTMNLSPTGGGKGSEVLLYPIERGRPQLPEGFVWVPLRVIELDSGLKGVESVEDFKKVPYDEMLWGLNTLRTEILPQIAVSPERSRADYWRQLDAASGSLYATGSQRIFEAFFGSTDFIYLERGKGKEKFCITNGRHRIKAALDAGWDAVPARIKDLNYL